MIAIGGGAIAKKELEYFVELTTQKEATPKQVAVLKTEMKNTELDASEKGRLFADVVEAESELLTNDLVYGEVWSYFQANLASFTKVNDAVLLPEPVTGEKGNKGIKWVEHFSEKKVQDAWGQRSGTLLLQHKVINNP